jgi:hypothetical protein
MSGDVFSSAAEGAHRIGRYQETLNPILMDVTGDQIPDFVGTTGVATFEFFVGSEAWGLGTITTNNVSFIQSVMPTGQFVVGSQGTIVAATRLLSQVSGSFASQSTVALGPAFQMETLVQFTVSTPNISAFVLMAVCDDGPARSVECPGKSHHSHQHGNSGHGSSHGHVGHHHHSTCDHRHDHHAERSRHERAIDQNLEAGVDWSLGDVLGEGQTKHSGQGQRRGHLAA